MCFLVVRWCLVCPRTMRGQDLVLLRCVQLKRCQVTCLLSLVGVFLAALKPMPLLLMIVVVVVSLAVDTGAQTQRFQDLDLLAERITTEVPVFRTVTPQVWCHWLLCYCCY